MQKKILFLDTETTSKEGRMIQLAFKEPTDEKCKVFMYQPPEPVTIGAMAIHHITNEMLKDCQTLEETPEHRELLKNIFAESVIVAHNAPFDVAVLRREGFEIDEAAGYIDTLQVAKHLIPDLEAHTLQYLRYYFALQFAEPINPHDAESDVIVLEGVFNQLAILLADQESFGPETLSSDEPGVIEQRMIELTHEPVLMKTLPFGKYKSKTFEEVKKVDRGYLSWLHDQNDLSPDLKATLNFHLLGRKLV